MEQLTAEKAKEIMNRVTEQQNIAAGTEQTKFLLAEIEKRASAGYCALECDNMYVNIHAAVALRNLGYDIKVHMPGTMNGYQVQTVISWL